MKKITFFLVLTMAVSMLTLTAQKSPMFVKADGGMNRDAEYGCLPNSVFSQLPASLSTGWYADNGVAFTRVADDYTVTGPFSSMRFWGVNHPGCPAGTTQDFIIKFYQRNPGNLSIPGVEVNSFTITIVPQPIVLSFGNDYMIDLTFNVPVTLLDGWVSITRINPGDGCYFVWLGDEDAGGNSETYYDPEQRWIGSNGMLAFCLGGDLPPQTPVSNWALIIGMMLIGTFVIVRFRKLV